MTDISEELIKEQQANVLPAAGAKLLYRSASGLEKAMADVDAERLIGTYAEIVIDQWDPYRISYNNLPYLSYAMGVLLWEEGWSESTQREWTARQFEYKSLRGTLDGIEMALSFTGRDFVGAPGYEVVQALRPPQGFFASPDMTKEAYDFWISQMPELRFTFYQGVGWDGVDVMYVQDGGVNDFVGLDDGWELYGRKTFLRIKGVDVPLETYTFTKTVNGVKSIDYERVSIPGLAGPAYIGTEDFISDEQFACAETIKPDLITVRVDGSYDHDASQLELSIVTPSMDPIDVRYTRNSDIGWGDSFFFVNDWCDYRNLMPPEVPAHPIQLPPWDPSIKPPPTNYTDKSQAYFADPGFDAARLLADRIFLYDPTIVAAITGGVSFVGVDYVSWPAYTADLMINLHTEDEVESWFADEGIVTDDRYFASQVQMQDFDRACRAVVTSQALRDRVRVAFDPTRLIELRDRAFTETTVDQQVPNLL